MTKMILFIRVHHNIIFKNFIIKSFFRRLFLINIQVTMISIYRSVGGIRASLYNAITEDEAETLADYMKWFHNEHTNNLKNN